MGAYRDVRGATAEVVGHEGMRVLEDPKAFASYVADLLDPDSVEARVLLGQCDERFLSHFANGLRVGTRDAMADASARAASELAVGRAIDITFARRLCDDIAEGVCYAMQLRGGPDDSGAAGAGHDAQEGYERDRGGGPERDEAGDVRAKRNVSDGRRSRLALVIVVVSVAAAVVVAALLVWRGQVGPVASSAQNDDKGVWKCVNAKEVDENGNPVFISEYTYDAHGNTLKKKSWFKGNGSDRYDSKDAYWYVDVWSDYDAYGFASQYETGTKLRDGTLYGSQSKYSIVYDLSDDGRPISYSAWRSPADGRYPDGDEWHVNAEHRTATYEYEGTRLVRAAETAENAEDDADVEAIEQRYDEHGEEVYCGHRHGGGVYECNSENAYDDRGNLTGCVNHISERDNGTGFLYDRAAPQYETRSTYEYDDAGHVIRGTYENKGGKVTVTENEFDERGVCRFTTEKVTGGAPTTTTYEYIYIADPSPVAKGTIQFEDWIYMYG